MKLWLITGLLLSGRVNRLINFSLSVNVSLAIVANPDSVPQFWCRLGGNLLKVNCDAAVKGNQADVACLVRDRSGSILDGFCKRVASGLSVLMVEALAVREACVFCLKAGIVEARIESDNAYVVAWCLKEDGIPPWEISPVICDIGSLAQSSSLFHGYSYIG